MFGLVSEKKYRIICRLAEEQLTINKRNKKLIVALRGRIDSDAVKIEKLEGNK